MASYWYSAPKRAAHEEVFRQVDAIARQQDEMRDNWVEYLEMYACGDVTGLGRSHAQSHYYAVETESGPDVRFNLAAALVDTGASLISQAPAVPQYLTTDGDFKLARKARRASEILQGQFTAEAKEVMKRAWLDAAKIGTGFTFEKFDPITGQPGIERVSAFEVYVEYLDGREMTPRSIHRKKTVPRETLKGQLGMDEVIDAARPLERSRETSLLTPDAGSGDFLPQFVEVVESWHLRPGKKGKGRHTICVNNATLLDEEWKRDGFPCAVFRYRERDFGFYGSGLIESCGPAQRRINDLIKRVARGQDLASNIIIFNPNGEDSVKPEKFTNEMGLVINYLPINGAPTLAKWDGTLGDLQNQIDLEFMRALQVEGISETQTNGQGAGRGLDSGAAVRASDDVQSRRLVPFVSRYQVACLGVARLFEAMNDACGKDIVAEGPGATFLRSAQWKDIRPPTGHAKLQMAAMSALPTAPAARWAAVMDWVQGGFVSRVYAMSLLQFPDLNAYASTELAHLELARYQIEQIIDGKTVMPDPRQDLDLAIDLATKSKMKAITMGADDDDLDLFENFLVYCEELVDQAMAQEAASQAPAAPPGGAVDPMTGLPTAAVAPGLGTAA